jgi:adenine-specific DNA-methyltransferase
MSKALSSVWVGEPMRLSNGDIQTRQFGSRQDTEILMAAIHDLLKQIEDPRLRERISREYETATRHKKFGLVFEQHLPELVPIYSALPRRGDLVARRGEPLKEVWRVRRIVGDAAILIQPRQAGERESAGERLTVPLADLLVVKQFGDPIFPTLTPIDSVQNGPADAPWHTLIEADNYHALQLLEYLYSGKVDCIYIDPPYNTGARDWKYNNDYVDGNDSWRHSKWLSFMEKRLRLAKRLLKPDTGVLICTIDEHEVHHLGVLMEEVFPECNRQMATIVINQKGVEQGRLARVEEYAMFAFMPSAVVTPRFDDLLSPPRPDQKRFKTPRWEWLLRGGNNSLRTDSPSMFYPIYVDPSSKAITGVGSALALEEEPEFREDRTVAWPVKGGGILGNWQVGVATFKDLVSKGYVKLGGYDSKRKTWTILYLNKRSRNRIDSGEILIVGKNEKAGCVEIEYAPNQSALHAIKTVWHRGLHDSGMHGSTLLSNIVGEGRQFTFPKSIYSTKDAISAVVRDNPKAIVVDFFAGSGTTLNAVNLLNAVEGGERQCILVTNNEVKADEIETLSQQGYEPGDPSWEARGICQSVTWPRSKFTILGRRDDGTPLPGDYITGRVAEREKPRRFRQLGFVTPEDFRLPEGLDAKALTKAAKKIAINQKTLVALIEGLPQNAVTEGCRFIARKEDKATVLFDPEAVEDWLTELDQQDQMADFYIVAESEKQFKTIKEQVDELLGPQTVQEEEKRPMAEGFAANLAYFKLDFLDKDQVELGAAFREILPLLWLKAGATGPRPELPSGSLPDWFAPEGSPLAVLLSEARINGLTSALKGRSGLSHVFIVTDAEEAFRALSDEIRATIGANNPDMQLVQLYRDYLANFMINTRVDDAPISTGSMA